MFRIPLHWKLASIPAGLALLLVWGALWLSGRALEERLRHEAGAQAEQAANLLAKRISRLIERRRSELQLISALPELQDTARAEERDAALERALRFSPSFVWLGLRNGRGALLASTGEAPQLTLGGGGAAAGRLQIGDVAVDPGFSRAMHQNLAESYVDLALRAEPPGHAAFEVVGRVAWRNVVQMRDDQRDDEPLGGVLRLVVMSGERLLVDDELPAGWQREVQRTERSGAGAAADADAPLLITAASQPVVAGGVPLRWRVYAVQDVASIVAPATSLKRTLAFGALFAALVFAVAGHVLSRRISRPYVPFLEAIARRVRDKPAEGGKALTRHLDAITAELDASPQVSALRQPATDVLDQLVEGAQRLHAVLEQVPAGVLLIGREGLLVFSNRAAADILRLDLEHHSGRFTHAFSDAATRHCMAETVAAAVDRGRTEPLRLNDGMLRWCHLRAAALTDRPGNRQGVLLVVQDISAEVQAQQHASALETHLHLLVEAARDYSFLRLDADGRVIPSGADAGRLDGYHAAELPGLAFASFFEPEARAAGLPQRLLAAARAGGRSEHAGWRLRRDGTRYWAQVSIYPLPDGTGYAQICRDLSEHRQAEQRLQASEARLSALVASASDGIVSVDEHERITLYNPAAERIFGHAAERVIGEDLALLMPHRVPQGGRVRARRHDGSEIELEASISQAAPDGEKVVTAIVRDITARVRAEEALMRYQRELQSLAQQLLTQEKATTARLAQALHDQLGQTLTALRLTLDAAAPAAEPAAPRNAVAMARELAAQAIHEVRHVLIELRPPLLDEQGLVAALDNEVSLQSDRHREVDILIEQHAPPGRRWPADVEYAAFMIAREALANALQHAGASVVRLALQAEDECLRLEIEDDGRGLPAGELRPRAGHFGVVGMRERAAAVAAHFSIGAHNEAGVLVTFEWQGP